jgi:hypothetical protein
MEIAAVRAYFPELVFSESYADEARLTTMNDEPVSCCPDLSSDITNHICSNSRCPLRFVEGRLQVVGFLGNHDAQTRGKPMKTFRTRRSLWREVMYFVTK